MNRLGAFLAFLASIAAAAGCGPGPGTHARVKFRDETDAAKAPAAFRMPLASIALVGEVDRDVFWRGDASEPIDFLGAVNDQVGSSMRNLSLGTYSHVEIRLCEDGDASATVEWQAPAGAPRSFETACVKTTALREEIAVSGGEQVTVVLAFDASTTPRVLDTGDDCDGRTCFAVPAFVPRLDVEIVVE